MPVHMLMSAAIKTLAVVLATAAFATVAAAGEFYEKDGTAIQGYDAVAYFTDGKPVKGLPEHKAEFKGSTFHFRSRANRDAFAADPVKYAPQYGGFCAFGTAGGYKAATQPGAFTIVGNKLYLNYNPSVQRKWSGDIPGYVRSADGKWPDVSRQTKVVE